MCASILPASQQLVGTVTPAFDQPRAHALPLQTVCHLLGSGNQLHPTPYGTSTPCGRRLLLCFRSLRYDIAGCWETTQHATFNPVPSHPQHNLQPPSPPAAPAAIRHAQTFASLSCLCHDPPPPQVPAA